MEFILVFSLWSMYYVQISTRELMKLSHLLYLIVYKSFIHKSLIIDCLISTLPQQEKRESFIIQILVNFTNKTEINY